MTRPLPVLTLLLALVGGWTSAAVHHAHHGVDWGHERAAHLASAAHASAADLLTPPCTDDTAHEAPCGVCQTLHGTDGARRAMAIAIGDDRPMADVADVRTGRSTAASWARGPPVETA